MNKLNELDPKLQLIVLEVDKVINCQILVGKRGQVDQDKAFAEKKSKLKFPNSKHNTAPSRAMDLVSLPLDWNNLKQFYYFAGIVLGIAAKLNIKLRWGGDWDRDHDLTDQDFQDLIHFELVD